MSIKNFPIHTHLEVKFYELVEKHGYTCQFLDSWRYDKKAFIYPLIDKDYKIIQYFQPTDIKESFLFEIENGLVNVDFSRQFISTHVFTKDVISYDKWLKVFKKKFPVLPELEGEQVEVKFWFNTGSGPQAVNREITVPSWEEVIENYSPQTQKSLAELIDGFKPSNKSERTGQLILWHGPPGTGKTYALRALIKKWRKWCGGEYIVDPDALFGFSAGYLINMLVNGSPDYYYDDEDDGHKKDDKWRLLILEDTGELLQPTAKETAGQGLSRLLNLVDGLIGQGLKILVLITTNEEISTLHPAVSREGRCLASIEFKNFSPQESLDWAEKHNVEVESKEHTLAELYSKIKDKSPIVNQSKKGKLGFQMPTSIRH